MVAQNFVCCLYVAAALYAGMALYALTRPPNVVNRILALLMTICAAWVVVYKQEFSAPSVSEKILWMRGRYLVIPFFTPLWVMLTAHLSNFHKRVPPVVWYCLFLVPMLTALSAYTLQSHQLFRYDFATAVEAPLSVLTYRNGPFGLLHEMYTGIFLMFGLVLLAMAWCKADTSRRRNQLMLLLIFGLLPITAQWVFALTPSTFCEINPAPILLLPASAVMATAIFWYGLTDVAPFIVRRLLFDINHDGTVVTDTTGRIVELNRTAVGMLTPDLPAPMKGLMIDTLPPPWANAISLTGPETLQFQHTGSSASMWFECTRTPVIEKDYAVGWMFVIRDISDHIALQAQQIDDVRRVFEEARIRQWSALLRDLHDGLGSVAVNLTLLADRAIKTNDPVEKETLLGQIADFAADGNAELRAMMNMLDCPEMTWADIFSEARRFSELILSAQSIAFHLSVNGTPGPVPAIDRATSLLRIIKEAVHNAAKHSGASEIALTFDFSAQSIHLTVCDNGTWKGGRSEGRGMSHIRQRVAALHGTIGIQTLSGTCLTCVIPATEPQSKPSSL